MQSRSFAVGALALLVTLSGGVVGVPTDVTPAEPSNRISDCTTITESGVYELTADIDDTSDADRRACILVRSGNVTVDGNGHTITGSGDSIFVGTAVPGTETAEYLPNVTVRDVVVTSDVELYRTPGATVQNITGRDSLIGIDEGNGSVLADNTLSGNTERGASVSVFRSNGSVIANNTVINGEEHRQYGVGSVRVWFSDDVTVRDNVGQSNATGLDVAGATNSTFVNNTVTGSDGQGLEITWGSRNNVFEDTDVSDSAVGVVASDSAGNAFRNVTATNTSDAVLDAREGGSNRFDGLRVGPNTTASVTGRNLVVRSVDAPPAVPSDLVAVGGFLEAIQYRGAELSLDISYDETTVDATGLSESDLRLYRYPAEEAPSHVYALMGSTTGSEVLDGWEPVPGPNVVNSTENVVSADVPEYDFGDPDKPTNATPLAVNETVDGSIASDEVDWYALDVRAGEAILPTLSMVGPLEGRSLELLIRGPDGESIEAMTSDIPLRYYVVGENWLHGYVRQTPGAATAETNGTYYVGVRAGETRTTIPPGPYNLTVETRGQDPFDPNQRRETATSVEIGERVTGSASAYDEDWFAFQADAGEQITIDARLTYPLALSVYAPDGEWIAETDYGATLEGTERTVNVTANRTGRYYVRLHQYELNDELLYVGSYALTVRPTGGDESADTDGDGLTDREEADVYGTDPTMTDTDGDGWSDFSEANRDCDPLDPLSHP